MHWGVRTTRIKLPINKHMLAPTQPVHTMYIRDSPSRSADIYEVNHAKTHPFCLLHGLFAQAPLFRNATLGMELLRWHLPDSPELSKMLAGQLFSQVQKTQGKPCLFSQCEWTYHN